MSPPRPAWIGETIRAAERKVIRDLILAAAATAGLIVLFSGVAHSAPAEAVVTCDQRGCSDWQAVPVATKHRTVTRATVDASGNTVVLGGRPAGCPRAYCGCGLRKYLGIEDTSLDLAWNWARKFQRAHAAPGMAVVWRHHVALIEEIVSPSEARLRDYNSGRGLSRIHVRSIAGAVVVNPSARIAVLQ